MQEKPPEGALIVLWDDVVEANISSTVPKKKSISTKVQLKSLVTF